MKVELNVPTSLADITLGDYQRFLKAVKDEENEYMIQQHVLTILCGLNATQARYVKAVDAKAITDLVFEIFEQEPKLVRTFKMNGQKFGFIPDLNEMSFGEMVDIDKYIGDYETIHLSMSAMYRPIETEHKDLYTIKDYVPNSFDMKQMPMDAVVGSVVFFYHLGKDLSIVTMDSLQNSKEVESLQNQVSQQSGVGINPFMLSLKEMLQDLKISLN